ncbi:MAG: ABC transporter ATP-binding protein [Clostridia bacterium]|nr:ABC transporter ATP-binding protein [Clostridia bacterium]
MASDIDVILQVNSLIKKFGNLVAVNDVSFYVERGSFFAFLGPNGAGKSTTINIITTLLKQDSGDYYINGKNDDFYIRNKIGVVFQENILDNFLTVKENLCYRGALYLKNDKLVKERYDEIRVTLNLEEFENTKYKNLSGGQKRRVEIARALFANPEILLLDEPTTGLDPESRKVVWAILKDLQKNNNITIFLTTHYMEEANDADFVVIINKGKIVAKGTPSELKQQYAKDIFKIIPKNKTNLKNYLKELALPFERVADQFIIENPEPEQAIKVLNDNKDNVKQFELIHGSMDDVFIKVVNGKQDTKTENLENNKSQ